MSFLADQGKTVPFLKILISREVASSDTPTTLFRRNSVATKMLSSFTASVGAEFLECVLSKLIASAGSIAPSEVELNPEKGGTAASAPNLTSLCSLLIKSCLGAIPNCPVDLRELSEHLKLVVSERFGEKMGVTAVGGFIFLRFVCPAMIAPERFNLVKGELSKDARRNLMSVSKVIQNMANGMTSFKEEYMKPMDEFLQKNGPNCSSFLDAIAQHPPDAPPPLPLDTLPLELSKEAKECLLAIHQQLKKHIHKIGSIIAAKDSADGLSTIKNSGEKAGWLYKRGHSSVTKWKKRWFVLKGNMLTYLDSPQAVSISGRCPLEGTRVQIVNETEFILVGEGRSLELLAESEVEQKDWVRALEKIANSLKETADHKVVPEVEGKEKVSNGINDFMFFVF